MGRVKSEETHRKLLDAGLQSFLEKGYHGSGLKEILDQVDVPKGSFYAYFASKEDFAVAVIHHYSASFAAKMEEVTRKHRSSRRGLLAFLRLLSDEFESNGFRCGCLIANLTGELEDSEPVRLALKADYDDWQRRVEELIARGQQAEEFRSDLPASQLAALLVDSWEGAVLRMKATRSREPLNRCINLVVEDHLAP